LAWRLPSPALYPADDGFRWASSGWSLFLSIISSIVRRCSRPRSRNQVMFRAPCFFIRLEFSGNDIAKNLAFVKIIRSLTNFLLYFAILFCLSSLFSSWHVALILSQEDVICSCRVSSSTLLSSIEGCGVDSLFLLFLVQHPLMKVFVIERIQEFW